jgi:hypothetical protein
MNRKLSPTVVKKIHIALRCTSYAKPAAFLVPMDMRGVDDGRKHESQHVRKF